ncbi:hypothetical protein SAMD00019534_054120 [Acytostelium subglobosum LB1]|uniref:hypothetical protein n=1 Tax=Acytostelium subglobosum LB1 TaxID=1410327 RepID=UPI0006450A07|nr:hypothetical protein SAMD00019534_054120 [Acytostelium subglobosum LB1]GAM22237.1 hypothetical protein SAMD00019534_054120 [Acytostelium subglobosum LB1]|eukprot:XP_012754357.1 hypothetical protein SAMD00019534_054120 [Acytostelium subglobosum LB1]
MVVSVQQIEDRIKGNFPGDHINVEDVSGGCGAKFTVTVGSDKFVGMPLLQRHRMVNDIIGDLMNEIHAVNLNTWTMKQYEEKTAAAK